MNCNFYSYFLPAIIKLYLAEVLNQKQITITGQKVLPGRIYRCFLIMTYDKNSSGNKTSARSRKFPVTTVERKGK